MVSIVKGNKDSTSSTAINDAGHNYHIQELDSNAGHICLEKLVNHFGQELPINVSANSITNYSTVLYRSNTATVIISKSAKRNNGIMNENRQLQIITKISMLFVMSDPF